MNDEKNIKRLHELREYCKKLHNIGVFIDGGIQYDEYMKDSVGELHYEFDEKEGNIDDDFVKETIEPEIEFFKLELNKIKKMCNDNDICSLKNKKQTLPKKPPKYKRITIEQYAEYQTLKK